MNRILYTIFLLISMCLSVNLVAAQKINCRLMGCVHEGDDAIVVLSLVNDNPTAVNCQLEKTGLNSLKAEAVDGRTFTDIQCFANSKCVTDNNQCYPFKVYPKQDNYVTLIINDVPKDLNHFNNISLILKDNDKVSQKFSFSNVDVVAEAISLPD